MESFSTVFILQLNILAAIVLLSIALGIFFKKNNAIPNIFLGIMMLYPAMSILLNIILIILAQHQFLFLAPLNIGFNLTFGPVLLTYLHFIQGKSGSFPATDWRHFLPSFIVSCTSVHYLSIAEETQRALLKKVLMGESLFINLINIFLLIHLGMYLYIAWKRVRRFADSASDLEIPATENAVKWQKSLLQVIITINVLLLLGYLLPILWTGKAHIYSDLIIVPVTAFLLYSFMLYRGLTYHVIYNKSDYTAFTEAAEPLHDFIAELKVQKNDNPQQPIYKDEFILDTQNRLQQLIHDQKVFTKTGLKLHDVAEMLKVSPAVLSFVINKHLKMTFFEMITKYRVEEAKRLLLKPDHSHYKIEYIGEISGFNSRASFFSVFKKQVGKTPLAFRDEHRNSKS